MDGIVDSLRLGWNALLLKEEAYEEMSAAESPVVKGLVLIVVVGVVIALLALVGTALEWATMPDLGEIKDIIFGYIWQMPGMADLARENPGFAEQYRRTRQEHHHPARQHLAPPHAVGVPARAGFPGRLRPLAGQRPVQVQAARQQRGRACGQGGGRARRRGADGTVANGLRIS